MKANDMESVITALVLLDRLAAILQTVGARVRESIASGRPITDADLGAQAGQADTAIAAARADIAARRAGGA